MNCRFEFTFTVLAISTVLSGFFTITVTVTIVLDFAVPTIIHQHTWDAVSAVSTFVVTVPAIVLSRGEVSTTAASRRWRASATARRTTPSWSTLTLTARIETP